MLKFENGKCGVLKEEDHGRVVASLPQVLKAANIPMACAHMLAEPLQPYVGDLELKYVTQIRKQLAHGVMGVMYDNVPDLTSRMHRVAACLLRNFQDARVYTVGELLQLIARNAPHSPTVLLVPNFALEGQKFFDREQSLLADLVLSRQLEGKATFIGTEGLDEVQRLYGPAFAENINTKFVVTEG